MKSASELNNETSIELIVNAQKVVHLDTGGKGHHLALAKRVRAAMTEDEASQILVDYEKMRMQGVKNAQDRRLNILKERIRKFI